MSLASLVVSVTRECVGANAERLTPPWHNPVPWSYMVAPAVYLRVNPVCQDLDKAYGKDTLPPSMSSLTPRDVACALAVVASLGSSLPRARPAP